MGSVSIVSEAMLEKVFSSTDPSTSLAGAVVTFSTEMDFFSDGLHYLSNLPAHDAPSAGFRLYLTKPLPSSEISSVGCRGLPATHVKHLHHKSSTEVQNPASFGSTDSAWFCHGLYAYFPAVIDFLSWWAWGSSCGGECGNPNAQLWVNQRLATGNHVDMAKGLDYKPPALCGAPGFQSSSESWRSDGQCTC